MPYTIEQINALDEAIATGALTVAYGGKTVTYRSLDDMLRIRGLMAQELGLLNRKPRIGYPTVSKGLGDGNGTGIENKERC